MIFILLSIISQTLKQKKKPKYIIMFNETQSISVFNLRLILFLTAVS